MRHFLKKSGFLLITAAIFTPLTLMAQSSELSFKAVKKNKGLTIQNCALAEGETKVKIDGSGKNVSLVTVKNRDSYNLGAKYKFFACDTAGVLFAKAKNTDAATAFDLSLTDFPKAENNVGSACKTVKSWPGSHIYKTIGSHHFTDVRRNTIGLILRIGASGPFPSCVDVIDVKGKSVAKMGLYARGAGWAARYYAGVNCGSGTPFNGSAIASRAKKSGGSTKIYMDFGTTCYGPIEANQCIGSVQC